ncbi:hypothetical protein B0T13DRAFT_444477 [Neurospora crassa]|nr:hypothetical protein B0T13DRAFT_444477 [Neurospora crassa]
MSIKNPQSTTNDQGTERWKYRFMNSIVPKRKIRVSWIVDPNQTKDRRYVNNDVPIAVTEEICREEADRLKLTCVVIRQLAHKTRNAYKNGRTVMVYDAESGQWKNAQQKADSYFTVYMGVSKSQKSQLLLQDHIHVVWDPVEFGNLKKMTDPLTQREYVSQ